MDQYVLLTNEQINRIARSDSNVWRILVWSVVALSLGGILIDKNSGVNTSGEIILIIILYLLYAVNSLVVFPMIRRESTKAIWVLGYFLVQFGLTTAIVVLTHGVSAVILIALVGQVNTTFAGWKVVVADALLFLIAIVPAVALHLPGQFEVGDVIATLGTLSVGMFLVQVSARAIRDRIELQRVSDELNGANAKLRLLAVNAGEDAAMKERSRLAREIHDTLGHYLTILNVQLATVHEQVRWKVPETAETIERMQGLVQEGLTEVRRSVSSMRSSPIENKSLPEILSALVQECRTSGIRADLLILGVPTMMNPNIRLALYRTAQEGLTNVRKHARASRIDILLDYRSETEARLVVADNGVGVRFEEVGYGLVGIRERISLLGGEVRIRTAPGQGFALEVTLPMQITGEAMPDPAQESIMANGAPRQIS